MFRFANNEMLYMLLVIPALIYLYYLLVKLRRKRLSRFGSLILLAGLAPEASPGRIRTKFVLFLFCLTFLILSLARPQLGAKLTEVTSEGLEIMFVVDVSNSMLARDLEPNRLERTKHAINSIMNELEGDRMGLVLFAGDAYLQLPMTSDFHTARTFVRQSSPNMVSRQGTALGAAIDLASNSFTSQSEGSRVMIIISDGENHEDDPVAAAALASEKGIVIYAIGVGTPEGSAIEIGGDYLRDEQGNMVVTKLDEKVLEEVALSTGGAYIRATNQSLGLSEILTRIGETEKTRLSVTQFEEYHELYRYFLITALFFLFAEFIILDRRNRVLARFTIFTGLGKNM